MNRIKIVIDITTDNAAFEGDGLSPEVTSIVGEAVQKIRSELTDLRHNQKTDWDVFTS